MARNYWLRGVIFLLSIFYMEAIAAQQNNAALSYQSNVIDTFFGTPVADPYRWLESQNSDSVADWLKAQKQITMAEKKKFAGRYVGVYNEMYANSSVSYLNLEKNGPYYFRLIHASSTGTALLYYRESVHGTDILAYDPNELSVHDRYIISAHSCSNDGQYLAVCLSKGGGDRNIIRIKNLRKDKNLNDKLDGVRAEPVVWWQDGFFYRRFNTTEDGLKVTSGQQLCYHKLGEEQSADLLIYSLSDKINDVFYYGISSDNQYLVLETLAKRGQGLHHIIVYKDLHEGLFSELQLLLSLPQKNNAVFQFIDVINGKFAVLTNYEAPTFKVLLFDKDTLNRGEELIDAHSEILRSVHHFGHKLFAVYFKAGLYSAAAYDYEGNLLSVIKFDTGIYVHGFSGDPDKDEVIFFENSFYIPNIAYTLDLKKNTYDILGKTTVHFDAKLYKTSLVSFKSKDGTEIPMYISYKKGMQRDGTNPVLLYGYGGFGVTTNPEYRFENIVLLDNGGILAVPLIRGGGEFGNEWHDAGRLLKKQNSFDDFIGAAEFLIKEKYTNKDRLVIKGGSNGGLLVGAVLTQRPDLFKVAVAYMGVYDMYRYHLFTGGRFWESEYGVSTNAQQFYNLYQYSPLHHVSAGVNYPATLLFTAANDNRVPPFHTYKFLAELQHKSAGSNPHIMYFEDDAGHNGAPVVDDYIKQSAFELAFIFTQLDMKLHTDIK